MMYSWIIIVYVKYLGNMSFFSKIYFEGRSDIHTVYLTLIQDELDLQKILHALDPNPTNKHVY